MVLKLLFWPVASSGLCLEWVFLLLWSGLYDYVGPVFLVYAAFIGFLLIRNHSIYAIRKGILDTYGPEEYEKLPDHETMTFEIWKGPQHYYRMVRGFDKE